MSTALKVVSNEVVSTLEADIIDAEQLIDQSMINEGEEWVIQAEQLVRIKEDFKKAKETGETPFGMGSFKEYCRSERSRFQLTHSKRLTAALPDYRLAKRVAPNGASIVWTEGALREVRKLDKDRTRKSVLKLAAQAHVERGIPLGTAVRHEVARKLNTLQNRFDSERDAAEQLDPVKNLERLIAWTDKHLVVLENQPRKFWEVAEKSSPGIAKRAAKSLETLAAFLRS